MRIRIEATPDELRAKGPALLEVLAEKLAPHAPDIAGDLRKASAPEEPAAPRELKHQALRDIHAHIRTRYALTLEAMLADIGTRLDRHIEEQYPEDDHPPSTWAWEPASLAALDSSLEKAGPHKYLTKVFSHGHWIYDYAEAHGGKVVPHESDATSAVVKLPKTPAGHKAALDLHGHGKLTGAVLHGSAYVIVPVTSAEAAALPQHAPGYVPKGPSATTFPPSATTFPPSAPSGNSGAAFDHKAALDLLTSKTSLTHAQIREALTAPSVAGSDHIKAARAQITHVLFEHGAHPDALRSVLATQKPGASHARTEQITQGSAKGIAQAKIEFADVPTFDLAATPKVVAHDNPIKGYATAHMGTGVINVGVRPDTGKWATGDWRHELGHVLHGTLIQHVALDSIVQTEHAAANKRRTANPHGPDNAAWFEKHWGVVGPRALDDHKEFFAEAYRGYHRARFQEDAGGPAKGSASLAQYREFHPQMTRLFDAHYTAALLGELAKNGAW